MPTVETKPNSSSNIDISKQGIPVTIITGFLGSGKTTLLNLIGGLSRPTTGSLLVEGVALEKANPAKLVRFRREKIGFVFQFFHGMIIWYGGMAVVQDENEKEIRHHPSNC